METLSYLLSRAKECGFTKECGFINGFLVGRRHDAGVEVSHLVFVDDVLILCDAS